MPVVSARKIGTGRGGLMSVERNLYEATDVYNVTCSLAADDIEVIRRSGYVPNLWDTHATNPNLRVKSLNIRQSHGNFIHEVEVKYDNQPASRTIPQLAEQFQPNPLLQRVKVTGKSIHATESLESVYRIAIATQNDWGTGAGRSFPTQKTPYVNTANDAFEAQEKFADQFGWDVELNVETIPFYLNEYQDTINSVPVTIRGITLPRWTLMFRDFAHSDLLTWQLSANTSPVYYYHVRFGLYFKRSTWIKGTHNLGFEALGEDGKKTMIVDKYGNRVSHPAPLAASGAKMNNPTADSILDCWDSPYEQSDWAYLPDLAT